MFGEHDEHDSAPERARAPSPWDPFLPSPPNDPAPAHALSKHFRNGIPTLAPEVEEGNVEYKLKLTHISPARFARLVTQLKWRLLEGAGQAYYELGVADSGALIGLARADLEASLATLEEMAAEIGASVVVVKEIEVPPALAARADAENGLLDGAGGWARKMTKKIRKREATTPTTETEPEATPLATETEPELEEYTDGEEAVSSRSDLDTPADSTRASPHPALGTTHAARRVTSNPYRPAAQSSPFIAPLDDDLALFSMEPEAPHRTDLDECAGEAEDVRLAVDLEIASVYKPRPVRRRAAPTTAAHEPALALALGKQARRSKYEKEKKKPQPWHTKACADDVQVGGTAGLVPNKQETKAARRQMARDRRREERKKALLVSNEAAAEALLDTQVGASGLADATVSAAAPHETAVNDTAAADVAVQDETVELEEQLEALEVAAEIPAASEPRLIVEALVVRKMSIEEAFGGFSLM